MSARRLGSASSRYHWCVYQPTAACEGLLTTLPRRYSPTRPAREIFRLVRSRPPHPLRHAREKSSLVARVVASVEPRRCFSPRRLRRPPQAAGTISTVTTGEAATAQKLRRQPPVTRPQPSPHSRLPSLFYTTTSFATPPFPPARAPVSITLHHPREELHTVSSGASESSSSEFSSDEYDYEHDHEHRDGYQPQRQEYANGDSYSRSHAYGTEYQEYQQYRDGGAASSSTNYDQPSEYEVQGQPSEASPHYRGVDAHEESLRRMRMLESLGGSSSSPIKDALANGAAAGLRDTHEGAQGAHGIMSRLDEMRERGNRLAARGAAGGWRVG